jgi:hypothetical protein
MAEWTPFQTHCYSENLAAPGIEHGTSELAARNSNHLTMEAVHTIQHLILKVAIGLFKIKGNKSK